MKRTSLLPVGVVSFAYLFAATPFAMRSGNNEFLFYIGIVVVIAVFIALMHRRVNFSKGLLWALSFWGLLHMLGGLLQVPEAWPTENDSHVLYGLWFLPGYLKYDNVVHAYGFAITTWGCWQALRAAAPAVRASFGVLTLCALAGMGLGAMNEIVEFMATILFERTGVGGFVNTGWDLVANFIGSAVVAAMIGAGERSR